MTNRLELNWNADGFFDEQRYYCSTSTIDVNALPSPKAVLANDVRTYVDTEITAGQTYYVRVSTVKNGVEKVSAETRIIAVTYKELILLHNPVAYYPLNEETGTVAVDVAASPANGAITNCLLGQTALSKNLGKCYYFNGNAKIELSTSSKFAISGAITYETWFKGTITSGNSIAIGYNAGLRIQISGSINVIFSNANQLSSPTLSSNTLYHIVVVCTSSNLKIYVNGALIASKSTTAWTGMQSIVTPTIGSSGSENNGGEYIAGYISNSALYDYELTQEQISAHYNLGIAA